MRQGTSSPLKRDDACQVACAKEKDRGLTSFIGIFIEKVSDKDMLIDVL